MSGHKTRRDRWDDLAEECQNEAEFMSRVNVIARALAIAAVNAGYGMGWLQAVTEPARHAVAKKVDDMLPELDMVRETYHHNVELGYKDTKARKAKKDLRRAFEKAQAAGSSTVDSLLSEMGISLKELRAQLGMS